MSLDTFMTLTPLTPRINTYEASNSGSSYGSGFLYFYGVHVGCNYYFDSLEMQYNANEVILAYDPVLLSDKVFYSYYKHCTMKLVVTSSNVSVENQYLMIFHLNARYGEEPTAQFFVGAELVREEKIIGEEQVALLMDVPGNDVDVYVYVRLACLGNIYYQLGIKGVDIFLL